ncbi:MAG: hypothetical protein FJ104_07995 [Deltaproteobacteria bacterium]|nr:hypothetical protein [Deltaproteobacteria bacterium]
MRSRHRWFTFGTLTVALLSAAVPAGAAGDEPSVEEIKAAESAFKQGREAFKAGEFAEAAEAFESADAAAPNDRVLELAITSRDKAGNLDRAATLARLGLDRYPDSERMRKLAGPIVDRAAQELVTVAVTCNEPCALLDGARVVHGSAALNRTLYVSQGDHTLRAAWPGNRAQAKEITGSAGETVSASFVAPTGAPEATSTPAATETGEKADTAAASGGLPPLVFWIGAGVTGVLAGVSIWSGVDAMNNPGKEAVRERCRGLGESCPEYQEGLDAEFRTNLLWGGTAVAGVATGVVGALLVDWSGGGGDATKDKASVAPYVALDRGVAVGASGRF